jgi:hypothetical protein
MATNYVSVNCVQILRVVEEMFDVKRSIRGLLGDRKLAVCEFTAQERELRYRGVNYRGVN